MMARQAHRGIAQQREVARVVAQDQELGDLVLVAIDVVLNGNSVDGDFL